MIRACDGHRGHGEGGCGFSTSTWPGGECPMCGGEMVDRAPPAPPAPRRPVAGWVEIGPGHLMLAAGIATAFVYLPRPPSHPGGPVREVRGWSVEVNATVRSGYVATADGDASAQLAAEDTLRAVLVDAAAALGLRVVPS